MQLNYWIVNLAKAKSKKIPQKTVVINQLKPPAVMSIQRCIQLWPAGGPLKTPFNLNYVPFKIDPLFKWIQCKKKKKNPVIEY